MKLRTLVYDKLVEQLREGQEISLSDSEYLGITLREKIYLPEDKEIRNDPVRRATSEQLAEQGGNVFWLLLGGVVESGLEFPRLIEGKAIAASLGFKAGCLLDFSFFLPFVSSLDSIEAILADHRFALPITAEDVENLPPGSVVQFTGRGTAGLSAGIGWIEPQGSVHLSGAAEQQGNFSLRMVREQGRFIRVQLVKVHSWTREITLEAKIGWSIGIGDLVGNVPAPDPASVLRLDLERITGPLPGWGGKMNLSDYLAKNGLDKIEDILKNYTEFYGKLGKKYTRKESNLTTFRLDLSRATARSAYGSLLLLDENRAAQYVQMKNSGVDRRCYSERDTLETTSFGLKYPGRLRLLLSSLMRERQGTLIYNDTVQLIRSTSAGFQHTLPVSGDCRIRWEGLQIIVNGQPDPRSYWMLSLESQDRNARKKEIVRFCRFAALLGVHPIEENRISTFPWFKRLISSEDDTRVELSLYFTSAAMEQIIFAQKDTVRSCCFTVAAELGDITPGAPWHDYEARALMHQYSRLTANDWGDDREKDRLSELYSAGFAYRNLAADARVLQCAVNIWTAVRNTRKESGADINRARLDRIFSSIGQKEKFHYMVTTGALAKIAGPDNTLVDLLEMKQSERNKIIVRTDEENHLISGEELFNRAADQIAFANLS